MSITGNLKTMPLPELLQWLSGSNKTGTLVIDSGTIEKKIVFQDGRIISSASTDPREYLGQVLVSQGHITETELSQAMAMQQKTQMLLGKILVTIGAITEAELHRLLRFKAEQTIYEIFFWEQGDFRLLDGDLPEQVMIPISLDVQALILEGVRRVDEWHRIRALIPDEQAIPVAMCDLLDEPSLSEESRKILSLVNDDRTVAEICLEARSDEYRTSKVLFDQARDGRIKVIRPRASLPVAGGGSDGATGSAESGDSSRSAASSAAAGGAILHATGVDAQTLIDEASQYMEGGEFEHAVRFLRAARSLEPDSKKVKTAADETEAQIRSQIESTGIRLRSVPKLTRTMSELTGLQLSPQEGFVLTRIDGRYDIQSLIKISPLPQLDALLVFWRLLNAGHIEID